MGGEVHQARDAGVDLVTSQSYPTRLCWGFLPGVLPPPQLSAYAAGGLRTALWLGVADASSRTVPTGCGRGADSICSSAGQAVPLALAV